MNKIIFIFVLCLCACDRGKQGVASVLSQDSLETISKQWKTDSLGCSRLRDPEKIGLLVKQLKLVGEDSSLVLEYLGRPDEKNRIGNDITVFCYYMACGMKDGAGYNFYCNFKGKKMVSIQTAILNRQSGFLKFGADFFSWLQQLYCYYSDSRCINTWVRNIV